MKKDAKLSTKFAHMGRPAAGLGTSVSYPLGRYYIRLASPP